MRVCLTTSYSGDTGATHSLVALCGYLKEWQLSPIVILPEEGYLSRQLTLNKIDFQIIKSYPWVIDQKKKASKFEWLKWQVKKLVNYAAELKLAIWLAKNDIQLVHINAFTSSFGFRAAKMQHLPLVWHIREFIDEDLNKLLWNEKKSRDQLVQADRIICISAAIRQKFLVKDAAAKFQVIYNGVKPYSSQQLSQSKPLLNGDPLKLVVVGRIMEKKGQLAAVQLVNQLLKENDCQPYLEIVGHIQDKAYYEQLQAYIRKNQLKDHVVFLGVQPDIYPRLAQSDILLVPSYQEAFGRVTIEGQLAGRIVVGACSGATRELIRSGENGYLFSLEQPDQLYQMVKKILTNPERARKVAAAGLKQAQAEFTAYANARKIVQVYHELQGGS